MTTFLLQWLDESVTESFYTVSEADALARICELSQKGIMPRLFIEQPIRLKVTAAIEKRKRNRAPDYKVEWLTASKASAPEAATGVPPSPLVAPPAADSVCAAPGCDDPVLPGKPFCGPHDIGGVKPEVVAELRKSKGQPRAAALKDGPLPTLVPHG